MRLKSSVDVTKVVWVATAVRRSDQDSRDQRPLAALGRRCVGLG